MRRASIVVLALLHRSGYSLIQDDGRPLSLYGLDSPPKQISHINIAQSGGGSRAVSARTGQTFLRGA